MELITPEYAALNRELHGHGGYGISSAKWADEVNRVREETGSRTVLDYGCGQGKLASALDNPDWLVEYDPCVDGKETKPNHVEMIFCGDVMEHIEPHLLDNVIADIAKTSTKAALFIISTVPAKKKLPDGRNAHLIIESPDWWRKKLEERFYIFSWIHTGHQIIATCGSIYKIKQIIPKSAVSDTIRYEQSLLNCVKTDKRVLEAPRHEERVAIVGYGPSLHQTWHGLKAERRLYGAKIVTVSGAHDFLIERGIVPDIHIDVDPREHKAFFTKTPHPDVEYWMASCCHPKLIDQLLAFKLSLWHVFNSDTDVNITAPDGPDPGNWLISGGGSVGCRAICLMYTVGYRIFSIYGMDCSFTSEGEQHAGEHSGKVQTECMAMIGDRWFKTSKTLMATAKGFIDNFNTLHRASKKKNEPFLPGTTDLIEIFIHGDGFLAEMYRNELENGEAA